MSVSQPADMLKQRIIGSLNNLPPEGLKEIANFLDYIRFKFRPSKTWATPYKPIALGGLWKKEDIADTDIDDIRREMWGSLENKKL